MGQNFTYGLKAFTMHAGITFKLEIDIGSKNYSKIPSHLFGFVFVCLFLFGVFPVAQLRND